MSRPTPEVRDLDLQVQSGWVRNLDLYLNEAMIEAETIKLKTKSDFWTWGYAKYFPPYCLDSTKGFDL